MTEFLIVAGVGTLLAALVVIWPLARGGARARGRDTADAALYRDQLQELERDVARGTISEAEAEGARTEIARRLIAANRRIEAGDTLAPAPPRLSRLTAIAALVVTSALAAVLYLQVGSPGARDQPLTERRAAERAGLPNQAEAERLAAPNLSEPPALDPKYAQLLQRLEEVVASRPMDVEGHRLLAQNLALAGRWVKARAAYDKLVAIMGENASADDLAGHAEAMIGAVGGGYVSPEAIAALEAALRLDPTHISARYYAGFAMRQGGRLTDAVQLWQSLLDEDLASVQPRGREWQASLEQLIAETTAPPERGPTADDVRNAENMTPEERQAMIEGMVGQLEERLTESSGEPEEWVRLINAYMQLGRPDDARRIFDLSQEKIGEASARSFVRERALVMGLKLE